MSRRSQEEVSLGRKLSDTRMYLRLPFQVVKLTKGVLIGAGAVSLLSLYLLLHRPRRQTGSKWEVCLLLLLDLFLHVLFYCIAEQELCARYWLFRDDDWKTSTLAIQHVCQNSYLIDQACVTISISPSLFCFSFLPGRNLYDVIEALDAQVMMIVWKACSCDCPPIIPSISHRYKSSERRSLRFAIVPLPLLPPPRPLPRYHLHLHPLPQLLHLQHRLSLYLRQIFFMRFLLPNPFSLICSMPHFFLTTCLVLLTRFVFSLAPLFCFLASLLSISSSKTSLNDTRSELTSWQETNNSRMLSRMHDDGGAGWRRRRKTFVNPRPLLFRCQQQLGFSKFISISHMMWKHKLQMFLGKLLLRAFC